jgi:hypothetical protein
MDGVADKFGVAAQTIIDSTKSSRNYSLFDAHLQAMLQVTEIIFKDGPGARPRHAHGATEFRRLSLYFHIPPFDPRCLDRRRNCL